MSINFSKLTITLFFLLFILHHGVAQHKKSEKKLDSLHILLNKTYNKQKKATVLLEICKYYHTEKTRNLDSLSYYANTALKQISNNDNLLESKVDALYYKAYSLATKIDTIDKTTTYIAQIKTISEKLSYGMGLRYAAQLSAIISLNKNDTNMAILHYEKSYQIAKDYKLPKKIIFSDALDLCQIYFNNKYNKEIISNLLFENISIVEDDEIRLADRALFYFDLGFYNDVYNIDLDKAIEHYNKAIALYSKINDNLGLSIPLVNLAECYQKLNNHQKAVAIFNDALALVLDIKNESLYSYIYYGLGMSFFELKDYKKSEYNLRKAIKEKSVFNTYTEEADCLKKIGEIYIIKGNTAKGKSVIEKAIRSYKNGILGLKKQNALHPEISYAYKQISKTYELINNYKESLAYHTLYTSFNDSINNVQNTKVTERFKFLKEATEKNKEIENLENQNKLQQIKAEKEKTFKIGLLLFLTLIVFLLFIIYNRYRLKQKSFEIIEQKNEENKLLMREIHHRVKNNLQIISSLLGVQINNHFNNDELKTILLESQNKIKSMAIIHQNLYKGDKFARIAIAEYVDDLIAQIKSSFTNKSDDIIFDLDIIEKEIQIGLAVPLGLILNELITNSYKYAFTHKTNTQHKIFLKIEYIKEKEHYNLTIKDNGKGLPDNFDINTVTSFGLKLVSGLVAQLNGEIKVTQNHGTQYNILLKEPGTV